MRYGANCKNFINHKCASSTSLRTLSVFNEIFAEKKQVDDMMY